MKKESKQEEPKKKKKKKKEEGGRRTNKEAPRIKWTSTQVFSLMARLDEAEKEGEWKRVE